MEVQTIDKNEIDENSDINTECCGCDTSMNHPKNDFKTRLFKELTDLKDKIDKLEKFTKTETFSNLPMLEKELLTEQLEHMFKYFKVLVVRKFLIEEKN